MAKLALITGASSGIGLELAKVMAQKGHNLILVARSEEKLKEIGRGLERQYGVHVLAQGCDLSQRDSAQKLFETLVDLNPKIEFLVNNAGFGEVEDFISENLVQIHEMIQLNMTSLTDLCRLYGAQFADRASGSILNVASTAAYQPGPLMAVYYATKSYVLSFSLALRAELQARHVNVSTLCPGPTLSGFQARSGMSASRLERIQKLLPGAIMTSEEVAQLAYSGWQLHRAVIIPGWFNWVLARISQMTPHFVTSRIVMGINKKEDPKVETQ